MPDSVWASLVEAAKKYVPKSPGQALGEKIRHLYDESQEAKRRELEKEQFMEAARKAPPVVLPQQYVQMGPDGQPSGAPTPSGGTPGIATGHVYGSSLPGGQASVQYERHPGLPLPFKPQTPEDYKQQFIGMYGYAPSDAYSQANAARNNRLLEEQASKREAQAAASDKEQVARREALAAESDAVKK